MKVKNLTLVIFLFQNLFIFSQNSIIILYGCSSSGKTSISTELLRILPGSWKYIPSNKFRLNNGNALLWKEINQQVSYGHNIIVDTHNSEFLIDNPENIKVVVCLIYCSPEKLIEHVNSRNVENNPKNHRALKAVFQEYVHKFQSVSKNQPYIDKLNKIHLKNSYGLFTKMALKTIIHKFFQNTDQSIVYIAPKLKKYDCCIDTGKTSIAQSAAQIKERLTS
ncbi:AAA family ATPase [Candidatus Babeliales bacterium]|nr:AAA family ATPase [Candidatus Babeliales bacterium]